MRTVTAPLAPATLLARLLRADAARPFLTYYDLDRGGRVELSLATFHNWVAKTAGLLDDEGDVGPGDVVDVDLPAHWLGLVLAQASWTVGASLSFSGSTEAAMYVRSSDALEGDDQRGECASTRMVVSSMPLGGPARPPVPAEVIDLGRDALGYPDALTVPVSASDDSLLEADGLPTVEPGSRRLMVAERLDASVLVEALLVPLVSDGSVVLVAASSDSSSGGGERALATIADQERVGEVLTTGRR